MSKSRDRSKNIQRNRDKHIDCSCGFSSPSTMETWGNYRYNLPVSEMIVRYQQLIGTKNISCGHDDKQQNGPNNTDLLLESKKHFYIIDCDRESKTSCSCDPLHNVHSKLPFKLVHIANSKTVHRFLWFIRFPSFLVTTFYFHFIRFLDYWRTTVRCDFLFFY